MCAVRRSSKSHLGQFACAGSLVCRLGKYLSVLGMFLHDTSALATAGCPVAVRVLQRCFRYSSSARPRLRWSFVTFIACSVPAFFAANNS